MTIKMIATDVDGTILKYTGEFNPEVIECIHKLDESGIKVVIVTGRMHKSAKDKFLWKTTFGKPGGFGIVCLLY